MTYLNEIVAHHRARAGADHRSRVALIEEARAAPKPRPFRGAVTASRGVAVIAEVKRRSPSKGDLAVDLDPAVVARQYEAGGAVCLSVLTDEPHFGGSPDDLTRAREAVSLPVLRKDFTIDEADVCDARLMGADAVLLIVTALEDGELRSFRQLAVELGMAALVEVHDEGEVERAVVAGADLIGVNQRDLYSFEVDPERAVRLAERMPAGVTLVAESGITGADQLTALADAGYDAVLVGESLVTAPDPTVATAALVEAGTGRKRPAPPG